MKTTERNEAVSETREGGGGGGWNVTEGDATIVQILVTEIRSARVVAVALSESDIQVREVTVLEAEDVVDVAELERHAFVDVRGIREPTFIVL